LKTVETISQIFRTGNREVWFKREEPDISPEWLDGIHKAIEGCDVFVFMLSPASNSSNYCNFMLDHAVKNGKRIVVICVQPVDYKKVLKPLVHISWVMVTKDIGASQEELQNVCALAARSVDADTTHVQLHTRILKLAIEWERHDFEKSLLLTGKDLMRAQHWLSAASLGRTPQPTTLHLSFITASQSLDQSTRKRQVIAVFFAVIVAIGIAWPSWGVFFFSLIFSHFFVYFSSS
jgi:hypothetical protein